MTPIEIAYFKHFMYDKGLVGTFLYLYRNRRIQKELNKKIEGNPELIEKYFLQTSRKDVIMKAFSFYPNNTGERVDHTHDYWEDIDNKWQAYMDQNDDNFINDSWPTLRGSFKILRQNWDVEGYWNKDNCESTQEVYERMEIGLPLPNMIYEHGNSHIVREDKEQIKTNIHNASDGDFLVRVKRGKEDNIFRTIILFKKLVPLNDDTGRLIAKVYAFYSKHNKELRIGTEDSGNIMVDDSDRSVKFRAAYDYEKNLLLYQLSTIGLAWDDDNKQLVQKEDEPAEEPEEQPILEFVDEEETGDDPLAEFELFDFEKKSSRRLKPNEISINFNNSNKITFNMMESEVIYNSGLKYARLGKNKDGNICIIFNNNDGVRAINAHGGNRTSTHIALNNKGMCDKIRTFFNITKEYDKLCIETLRSTSDYLIYKLSKK